LNTPAFSLYDASAGSGKTYTLTKEYLKILFKASSDDAYKRILAITFTNKAVEEMKSRIVDSLYEFSKENTSNKAQGLLQDVVLETGLSVATIKEKSKAIIKNIIHNYAAFGISTIDKFTHKVIRAFAQDLNLPANFEVALDTDSLLQEAVDLVISKVGEEDKLTALLIEFTKDKADEDKNWDISKELVEVSKMLTNENNANEISQFQEKTFEDFTEIKNILKKKITEFEQNSVSESEEQLKFIEANVDLKSFAGGVSRGVVGFLSKTCKGELSYPTESTLSILNGEKSRYAKTVSQNDKDWIDDNSELILVSVLKINNYLGKINFYNAFLQNINPLSLLNTINIEFKKIQEEQNILSISDFNRIIFNEIQNQPAPFIYERLGEKYKHFFIDEFQDTSIMQWKNLIPLIDNALSSEENGVRGSLMLVGDPKQSIYRWRGGKAEQFIELSKKDNPYDVNQNPFSNKDKGVFRLERNYRSYSEVISFNNAFFEGLSNKFENVDYQDLYLNHSYQELNDKKGGFINISFIEVPKEEEDDFSFGFDDEDGVYSAKTKYYLSKTLETIEKVVSEGFNYKDIVLLTRKKADGVSLANFLTEQSVPILSSETLLIQNATEVKLIINVLQYLKSNKDQESKARFLYFIAKYKQSELAIHDFIIETKDLSEKALEAYLNSISIAISFKDCRKKSLYEVVEIIVSTFIKEKANTSYVQYFLDLVLERDSKTQASISDFLEYWDKTGFKKSIPSPKGNDAVRIMTIHSSKGLEFPVVIYPFAEESFTAPKRNKLWVDFDDEEQIDFPKALVNIKKEVAEYGENAKEVYNLKSQEEVLDNINVLYVALTRAEEQLYIISNHLRTKTGLPDNLSSYFIEFLESKGVYDELKLSYDFGSSQKISPENELQEEQKTIQMVSERLDAKVIKIAQRESLMWNTEQQKAIEFGNILHEIMSFVFSREDIEVAILKAIANGLITASQKDFFQEKITQITTNIELEDFFDGTGVVYNEETVLKKGVGNIKPDRVVVKNKTAYLLDYKTGDKKEIYKKQVSEYALALQEMDLNVAKKALVYIGEKIEIVLL
jgi:ATP-dependent exoDNAse (exonuclease V) beta subunit